MSANRHPRRQARRARRAGLQPIMVIDGPLPGPAGVLLARLAWRYRSEAAPAVTAGAVLALGWWLHAAYPHWWPLLLAASDLAAFAVFAFGGHIGLTRLAERVYLAGAILVTGAWLAAATVLGPVTLPMLPVLAFITLVFAVPWWADRRRLAWVRVQRAVSAWPDVARAIGLPGARIQSVRVSAWGWRASIKLASGQTIADLAARVPAVESALGAYRGAVRVYPAGEDRADWCELRVRYTSPHAEAARWPDPPARYPGDEPAEADEPGDALDGDDDAVLEGMLWNALRRAPEQGADVTELMQATGMDRFTVYSFLARLAEQGRAVQVDWGRWQADDPGQDDYRN